MEDESRVPINNIPPVRGQTGILTNKLNIYSVCAVHSRSVMSDYATPWTSSLGFFLHGDSPGQNTGVGCHALLLL